MVKFVEVFLGGYVFRMCDVWVLLLGGYVCRMWDMGFILWSEYEINYVGVCWIYFKDIWMYYVIVRLNKVEISWNLKFFFWMGYLKI